MRQLELMSPVNLAIRFEDLFVQSAPEQQRRDRWAQWLRTARANGEEGRYVVAVWMDYSECHGCTHKRGGWCSLQGLPCTVNPILSFRHGVPGMACMGLGYE